MQRVVLCAAGGLLHFFGGSHAPALAWIAVPLAIAGLSGARLRLAIPLGALIGALEAWHGFGIFSYGAIPVALFVGSGSLVRGVMAIPVALATRHLPALSWVPLVALLFPLVDASAEALLGPFYVPVALVDTQADCPTTLQVLSLGGSWALTAVMALWGALWVAALSEVRCGRRRRGVAFAVGAALLLTATLSYGWTRLANAELPTGRLRALAVQGGVPNWVYGASRFVPALEDAAQARYFETTQAMTPGRADLIIWPETSVRPSPAALPRIEQRLRDLSVASGAVLLVGVPRYNQDQQQRNAVLVIDNGVTVGEASKQHLVPLLEAEFEAAQEPGLIETRLGPIGVLNCVESLYRDPALTLARRGAALLVVVANDAGVGRAPLGMIHARRAALRAAENHIPVLHVAQYGATRFYDGYGRLLAASPSFGSTVVEAVVPVGAGRVDE